MDVKTFLCMWIICEEQNYVHLPVLSHIRDFGPLIGYMLRRVISTVGGMRVRCKR